MSESLTTATESSDYQSSSQQLPQLPEFDNTQWIDTMMQTSDMELMSSASTPLLL